MKMLRTMVAVQVVLAGVLATEVKARSFAEQIDTMFGDRGIVLDTTPDPQFGIPHDAHFSSASLAGLGLLTASLAATAADFPAVSTIPGFTYRYNPELEIYERSSQSLGSIYVERPLTLGKNKVDVGASYQYVDFDQLNGKSLDELNFPNLTHQSCCGGAVFEDDTADIRFEKFNLTSHVFSFFATYGITSRWDVNLVVPVVYTELEVRAQATLNDESNTDTHFFDQAAGTKQDTRSIDDSKFGVGDLKLRTKYNFLADPLGLAGGLVLNIPTGDEDNFQGIGDTTIQPFFTIGKEISIVDLHAAGGIEINCEDSDRSRVRYGAGAAVQLLKPLALLVDVIGSSNLQSDQITVDVPIFAGQVQTGTVPVTSTVSTDIVDLAIGVKGNIYGSAIGFFNVFVPLNRDGLRADWIPSVGVEASF